MRTVRRRPGQCLALALLLGTVSAIAASSLRWTGTSGGLRVAISDKDVVAADSNGIRSFSLKELFPNFESDDPEVDTHSAIYRPLSLVGPYLSLERDGSSFTPGAAHASIENGFVTLDLRKRERPVSLTRWFTEDQLLSALKKSSGVKEMVHAAGGDTDEIKYSVLTIDALDTVGLRTPWVTATLRASFPTEDGLKAVDVFVYRLRTSKGLNNTPYVSGTSVGYVDTDGSISQPAHPKFPR